MRPKNVMLADCATIGRDYAYLAKPGQMTAIRVAADVVDLLAALEAKDAEIRDLRADRSSVAEVGICPSCGDRLRDWADDEDPDWVIGKHCVSCNLGIDEMGETRR